MSETDKFASMKIDTNSLYRDETYTDHKVGTLRCMIPVTSDGATDSSRDTIYIGQTQIMTTMGPMPLSFEIDATTLTEACEKFGPAAQQAVEKTIEEAKEYQRQQASSIVVPGQGGMGGGPGIGGGGPGMGGGGFQMP